MRTVLLNRLVLPEAPICYGILMPGAHVENGVPVVKVRNYEHGQLELDELLRTSREIDGKYARSRLRSGDILLSIRGTTGRVAMVPDALEGANITQDSARLRVQPADRRYVYHMLQSPFVQRQIALHTIGQAVKGINIASVRKLELPWPVRAVRGAYVRVLDGIEETQRLLRRLIAEKLSLKGALMRDLLTERLRLPNCRRLPWTEASLGALFAERNETGFPNLRLLSVTAERGIIPREDVARKDTSNADKSKYQRVCVGDIAYNTMRMWQGVSALSAYEGIVSPAYTVLVPRGAMLARYARHLFKLPRTVHTFWRNSQGLVDDTLSLKYPSLARIGVRYPADLAEQARIADILDGLDHELTVLEQLHAAHQDEKRAVMHRLLSVERTVAESDAAEAEPVHA